MKTPRYTSFSPVCRVALLVVLSVSGCNKQQMPMPDQLQQQSETLPISGNTAMGKTFAIGDFRVDEVKRGGKGTVSASAGNVAGASASKQKFEFAFSSEGAPQPVSCEIQDKQSQVAFAGGNREISLTCTLGEWMLSLNGANGTLSRGEQSMQIATYTASAISLRPDGYYVRVEGSDLAAVSKSQMLIRTGVEADTRSALGAAAAALLIFSGIPS